MSDSKPERSRFKVWLDKLAAGGHEHASGRYPITTRKFATRPPGSGAVEDDDPSAGTRSRRIEKKE